MYSYHSSMMFLSLSARESTRVVKWVLLLLLTRLPFHSTHNIIIFVHCRGGFGWSHQQNIGCGDPVEDCHKVRPTWIGIDPIHTLYASSSSPVFVFFPHIMHTFSLCAHTAFRCVLHRMVVHHGKMFVFPNYLCWRENGGRVKVCCQYTKRPKTFP